jgi:hypothetical protein
MKRDIVTLCACLCALSAVAGLWLGSTATLAKPLEPVMVDDAPRAIPTGAEDVRAFFRQSGYTGTFSVAVALRDEALGRRYYHCRVAPEQVDALRTALARGWTLGRFNRAVYHNGVSSRVKKSRNLPKWWNLQDPPYADHLMLDHGGVPNWYVVTTNAGDVCLMWTGR